MQVKDLHFGDNIRFAGYSIFITDIEDTIVHYTKFDKIKRTITFDILDEGLFPVKLGWSFFVFFDLDEIISPEDDEEDEEDEDDEYYVTF